VARLKGLVLWLAWDCGLAMDLRKPFMESAEDRKKRLHANAMVLALAQMIKLDEVVIDEARQSIGSLTSSEMGWLKEIQRISQRCASIRGDSSGLRPATRCEPGDIAVHRTMDDWNLRIVESNGGKRVYLMALSRDKDRLAFASEHLAVAPLI
jgi:hypothetical protein